MRDRWSHEPALRSRFNRTALETINEAFVETNRQRRFNNRGCPQEPPQKSVLTLGQFAGLENDVDRLLCPSPPKHFLTRHGWIAFPYTALSFLSVLGTVPGCLLALTFEASSQPPFDKQGCGGVLSRSLTATKQTLRHRTRHPNRLLDTPPVAKGASWGIGRTKPGKSVVGVLVVWRAVFMAGFTLSTPAAAALAVSAVGGVCWLSAAVSGGVVVVCRPAGGWRGGWLSVVPGVRGQPRACGGRRQERGGPLGGPPLFVVGVGGGVLLSHTLAGAVPSALAVLASGFGKERSGRVPAAMTAATRSRAATPRPAGGVGFGYRIADANRPPPNERRERKSVLGWSAH